MTEIVEALAERDGQTVGQVRSLIEKNHGVTDRRRQDEMIAGFATVYLAGGAIEQSQVVLPPMSPEDLSLQ